MLLPLVTAPLLARRKSSLGRRVEKAGGWNASENGRLVTAGLGSPAAGGRFAQSADGWAASGSAGTRGLAGEAYHKPIMGPECVHFLQPGPGKLVLDGTLGGAGHTELFLESGSDVMATDRDLVAVERARQRLEPIYAERFSALQGNFADFPQLLAGAGVDRLLDGIFLDLGLSSRQLENASRGFSFMREGRLDMRFNPEEGVSAEDIVNTWDEAELRRLLQVYGEEPAAKHIARAIVTRRETKAILLTTDLAAVVASVVPQKGRTHPATRTFQALRYEVNQELPSLERALQAVPASLAVGGRLVILTFNSLEDRIAKHFLREHSLAEIDRPEWPRARVNPLHHFSLVMRKAVIATPAEIHANPRARSCKLRVAERIASPATTQH